MAKELPYFKFEPAEWQNGNIQMCSELTQLYFINMCCTYWSKLGDLKDRFALVKCFNNSKELFNELLDNEIITISNDGDITIPFLDTQLGEFKIKRKITSESGRKGGINNGVRPEIERKVGHQLYLLECWNNEERFYKMGITTSSISKRYSGKIQYQYKVVFQIFTDKFVEAENELCELLRSCEYKPLLNFAGQKECYLYSESQQIEEIINNYFDFAKATLQRNEAIREEESREEERKEDILPPTAKPKTFKQLSEEEFKHSLVEFVEEFGKKTVRSFFEYWSEKDAKGKMKFQLNQTWDSKRRLTTWKGNEPKFGTVEPEKTKPQKTEVTYSGPFHN